MIKVKASGLNDEQDDSDLVATLVSNLDGRLVIVDYRVYYEDGEDFGKRCMGKIVSIGRLSFRLDNAARTVVGYDDVWRIESYD